MVQHRDMVSVIGLGIECRDLRRSRIVPDEQVNAQRNPLGVFYRGERKLSSVA